MATLPKMNGGGAPTMGLFAALAKQGVGMKKSTNDGVDDLPPGSPTKSLKKHSMISEEAGGNSPNKLELVLNHALKRRMGMDYLSERSGIDMRKFTKEYV